MRHGLNIFIRRVCKILKSDYQLRHVCPSVCQHGTTRLPTEGFSLNLALIIFRKTFDKVQVQFKYHKNNVRAALCMQTNRQGYS